MRWRAEAQLPPKQDTTESSSDSDTEFANYHTSDARNMNQPQPQDIVFDYDFGVPSVKALGDIDREGRVPSEPEYDFGVEYQQDALMSDASLASSMGYMSISNPSGDSSGPGSPMGSCSSLGDVDTPTDAPGDDGGSSAGEEDHQNFYAQRDQPMEAGELNYRLFSEIILAKQYHHDNSNRGTESFHDFIIRNRLAVGHMLLADDQDEPVLYQQARKRLIQAKVPEVKLRVLHWDIKEKKLIPSEGTTFPRKQFHDARRFHLKNQTYTSKVEQRLKRHE